MMTDDPDVYWLTAGSVCTCSQQLCISSASGSSQPAMLRYIRDTVLAHIVTLKLHTMTHSHYYTICTLLGNLSLEALSVFCL